MTSPISRSASSTAVRGSSTNRACTFFHEVVKRCASSGGRLCSENAATRFCRSCRMRSASLTLPVVVTARSYSGPKRARNASVRRRLVSSSATTAATSATATTTTMSVLLSICSLLLSYEKRARQMPRNGRGGRGSGDQKARQRQPGFRAADEDAKYLRGDQEGASPQRRSVEAAVRHPVMDQQGDESQIGAAEEAEGTEPPHARQPADPGGEEFRRRDHHQALVRGREPAPHQRRAHERGEYDDCPHRHDHEPQARVAGGAPSAIDRHHPRQHRHDRG